MASEARSTAHALALKLQEEGPSFHFYSAVRRIECANPEMPKIGTSLKPSEDPVRFAQDPMMAFPTSTISRVIPDQLTNVPRMCVNFAGFLGPHGPLPLHLTEFARERIIHHSDHTLSRFLDVLHHRIISFFYRAWAVNQQTVSYEHFGEDHFAKYSGALFGQGMESAHERDAVPDTSKLHYAGRLMGAARNAEGLEAMLEDYFQIRTRVETFIGEWIELPDDSKCRLGESPRTGCLGTTAIVGARIWERQYKFRVIMGPMGYRDYQRMLPGGESLPRLISWVRNYIGDELGWDLQLILKKEEIPSAQLGKSGRLGWSTWTKVKPATRDADNLVIDPRQN